MVNPGDGPSTPIKRAVEFSDIVPGNRVLARDSFTGKGGEWAEVVDIDPKGLVLRFDSRGGNNGYYGESNILQIDSTVKLCPTCRGRGRV
jgi:hypothetical protein